MSYTITASNNGHPVAETRLRAASAILLADRWRDLGYRTIRIECDGQKLNVMAFRSRFVMTSAGMKPRKTAWA